ncbi:hypothetical protein AAHE18_14G129300 [Arachis hypogaea]
MLLLYPLVWEVLWHAKPYHRGIQTLPKLYALGTLTEMDLSWGKELEFYFWKTWSMQRLINLILLLAWEHSLVLFFATVEIGLLIAVFISFAKILLQFTRPRTCILGNIPRTTMYKNIHQYPEASKVPGVLIVRVDSAIYFSNPNFVKERILRWLIDG